MGLPITEGGGLHERPSRFRQASQGADCPADYQATGVNDDVRFERHVRSHLRKLAKMTKANEGFEKTLRYQ
jgi:hypothetical protein